MIERNGFPLVLGIIAAMVLALAIWRLTSGGNASALLVGGLSLATTALMLWQRRAS